MPLNHQRHLFPCRPVLPSLTRHTPTCRTRARMRRSARLQDKTAARKTPPAVAEKPAGSLRRGRRARDNTPPTARSSNLSVLALLGAFLVPLIVAVHRSLTMPGLFDAADQYALLLSLLAGLATSVGGIIAVWKKPDQKLLAFLLGVAIGVMSCLSVVELYVKNVIENGFMGITLASVAGAMTYVVLEPLLPKAEMFEAKVEPNVSDDAPSKMSKARLMRLGLLMAITMTLHNLPEGFAVAFSSFTSVGPIMAAAIGVHNVPEGIIVAAPVYAATGSRRTALALATASGLSEPAGALLALCFVKPYLTPMRLQYLLAGTGGMMLAVCVVELFPEGRKCRHDAQLGRGIAAGAVVMLGTLYVGV